MVEGENQEPIMIGHKTVDGTHGVKSHGRVWNTPTFTWSTGPLWAWQRDAEFEPSQTLRNRSSYQGCHCRQTEGAPGSVIHLQVRYRLLLFLVCAAVSELLNFCEFSYLSQKRHNTCFPWPRQGWSRLYSVWEILHGDTLSPYGLWDESVSFVLKVREFKLAPYSLPSPPFWL